MRIDRPRRCPPRAAAAFTLVELLVVIGIIALLISILLPGLAAARRSAAQTKCMAALKEIGNTFRMYSIDNRGYYPPAKLQPTASDYYDLYGVRYVPAGEKYGAFWFNFLSKYAQKGAIGTADTKGGNQSVNQTRSIFWGCPAFTAYADSTDAGSPGGNRYQIGYGMNGYPFYTESYPRPSAGGPFGGGGAPGTLNDIKEYAFTTDADDAHRWSRTNAAIGFVKESVFTKRGASRALIADSALWLLDAEAVPTSGIVGPNNFADINKSDTTSNATTTMSLWRHGKLPPPSATDAAMFPVTKGKLGYNILYADGHVAPSSDARDAFKTIRMKFPG